MVVGLQLCHYLSNDEFNSEMFKVKDSVLQSNPALENLESRECDVLLRKVCS